MVAGVAAFGQVVTLGQALEITTCKIVKKNIVVEVEERAEVLPEIVLDGEFGL